jgi:hypothetical protein
METLIVGETSRALSSEPQADARRTESRRAQLLRQDFAIVGKLRIPLQAKLRQFCSAPLQSLRCRSSSGPPPLPSAVSSRHSSASAARITALSFFLWPMTIANNFIASRSGSKLALSIETFEVLVIFLPLGQCTLITTEAIRAGIKKELAGTPSLTLTQRCSLHEVRCEGGLGTDALHQRGGCTPDVYSQARDTANYKNQGGGFSISRSFSGACLGLSFGP